MAADIRPARASDVDALSAIEDAVFDADRISKKSFRRLIESRTASVLVAANDRAIDGYCIVLFRASSRKARLYSIAVRLGSGHAGLGRALLGAAEQEATKRGADSLRLEVREDNARARELYARNTYRDIGLTPGYYADGATAFRLEKALAPAKVNAARPGTVSS
jgi:ribosomal protein S18 acetylase RimI-like enzyme